MRSKWSQAARVSAVLHAGIIAACGAEPPCTVDADCADTATTPFCEVGTGECIAPCTADVSDVYVCMEGRRHYCSRDEALPCTVCTRVCEPEGYCDASIEGCAPLKAAGATCASARECASGRCTAAGLCGARQGETCTAELCDGACASDGAGASYCIRECASDCWDSTAGGLSWACISFSDGNEYCVPVDDCFENGPCLLTDATCGLACTATGCLNYCLPNSLEPP